MNVLEEEKKRSGFDSERSEGRLKILLYPLFRGFLCCQVALYRFLFRFITVHTLFSWSRIVLPQFIVRSLSIYSVLFVFFNVYYVGLSVMQSLPACARGHARGVVDLGHLCRVGRAKSKE